jgi:hypothetical protein
VLLGKSIQHPKCPVQPGRLRATLLIGGFILEPIYPINPNNGADSSGSSGRVIDPDVEAGITGWSRVHFLAWPDLSGLLPKAITNKIGLKQPLIVHQIRKILEKQDNSKLLSYYREKKAQLPVYNI